MADASEASAGSSQALFTGIKPDQWGVMDRLFGHFAGGAASEGAETLMTQTQFVEVAILATCAAWGRLLTVVYCHSSPLSLDCWMRGSLSPWLRSYSR